MRGWVSWSHRKAEGFSACPGQSLLRRREAPLPSHRHPRWHLETGCSLWAAISSVGPAARSTLTPNCGKNHVMCNASLMVSLTGTSAGPSHRNKADGGDVTLCQRGPGGDISLATAFSILRANTHSHLKFSIEDAILSFLWPRANVQESVIRKNILSSVLLCFYFFIRIYWIFFITLLLFYVLIFWPQGMWDFNSPKSEKKSSRSVVSDSLQPHEL